MTATTEDLFIDMNRDMPVIEGEWIDKLGRIPREKPSTWDLCRFTFENGVKIILTKHQLAKVGKIQWCELPLKRATSN